MKQKNLNRAALFRNDSVDLEARTAEFVISTESVDSYGTVFLADGWDLERYNRNPVVTFNHEDLSSNPDMVIGTSKVRLEDKQLIATVKFEEADNNPVAEKIFRKVAAGILRGASIRADVSDGRMGEKSRGENPDVVYFTRHELLAWSIVTVQSNPDTLARNQQVLDEIKTALIPVREAEHIQAKKTKGMDYFEARAIVNNNSNI